MLLSLQEEIRSRRDEMLRNSDFTQLSDSPFSPEVKALWATYREELRDLPEEQNIDEMEELAEVVWPVQPA